MYPNKMHSDFAAWIIRAISLALVFYFLCLDPPGNALARQSAEDEIPTPAEVIEAVNNLREQNGLNTLSVHPVLMKVAQIEADGVASGSAGHWRPPGLTLGQWLISLGYPLAGDLTQDGYRSENWIAAKTVKTAINAWKWDAMHTNTMLSPDRSDIGVGIAVTDDIYIVLITALQTASGKMQSNASLILTQACSSTGETKGFMPLQYIKPVVLSTARPDGDVYHKIQYGQSLWSIAIAYHTTIDQLRAWNNLGEENTVYEGQVLLVQRGATQPPPATSTATTALSLLVQTDTPAPPTVLPTASSTVMVQPSLAVLSESVPVGFVPVGWRIGIVAALLGLGMVAALFLLPRKK